MNSKQQDLFLDNRHGGRRKGAGRKRKDKTLQRHNPRKEFKARYPLHITIRLKSGLPSLRRKKQFKLIKSAILKSREKGLKLIHFTVQSNHLHLLVESKNKQTLAKSMQSFCTSLAKKLNLSLKRRGQVFRDRYHVHILKTPREVVQALKYIFTNWAKHTKIKNRFDPYSTLVYLNNKARLGLSKILLPDKSICKHLKLGYLSLLSPPETWLVKNAV